MAQKRSRRTSSQKGCFSKVPAFLITDDGLRTVEVWQKATEDGWVCYCCPFHGDSKLLVLRLEQGFFQVKGKVFKLADVKPVDIKVPKPSFKHPVTHRCLDCGAKFNLLSRQGEPLEDLTIPEFVQTLS